MQHYRPALMAAQQAAYRHEYDTAIQLFEQLSQQCAKYRQWQRYAELASEWASVLLHIGNYTAAYALLTNASSTINRRSRSHRQHWSLAYIEVTLGRYYTFKGEYATAIHLLQTALTRLDQAATVAPQAVLQMRTYGNLGWTHSAMHHYDTALLHLQQSLAVWQQHIGSANTDLVNLYNNIGICYNQKGDYEKELSYYHKAADVLLTLPPEQQRSDELITIYGNIGATYNEIADYATALIFFEKALALLQDTQQQAAAQVARLYNNMGYSYMQLKKYAIALDYHQQALGLREQVWGKQHSLYANSCSNIGLCYFHDQQATLAIPFFEEALAIRQANLGKHSAPVGITYHYLADCWLVLQQLDTALQYCQQALAVFVPDFEARHHHSLPQTHQTATDCIRLLASLALKVRIWRAYRQQQHNPLAAQQYLLYAHQTVWQALAWVDEIRKGYRSEVSKLLLAQKATTLNHQAVDIAYLMYCQTPNDTHLQHLFAATERGKASVLVDGMRKLAAQKATDIAPHLRETQQQLLSELSTLDNRINEIRLHQPNNLGEISLYRNRRFEAYQQYEHWIQTIADLYPHYHALRFGQPALQLPELQQALSANTLVLSYYLTDHTLYLLGISQQHVAVYATPKPADLAAVCARFLQAINELQRKNYLQAAQQLYQYLLADVLAQHATTHTQHLLLLPDTNLYYLPFEAMLPPPPSTAPYAATPFADLPYLIKNYAVSYHYSAQMWLKAQQLHQQYKHQAASYLGIAPVYGSRQQQPATTSSSDPTALPSVRSVRLFERDYSPLWHSAAEVGRIAELFAAQAQPQRTLLYEAASITQFRQLAPQYTYVHLAAHGMYHPTEAELSGILLFDDNGQAAMFYVSDSYHLQLNADLVVLSACESGIGKALAGEGVWALNRGLLMAGAANVVHTLFKVFDEASSQLCYHFYTQLFNKNTPHHARYAYALQQAKLHMIAQAKHTPKSWAGFVLLGS